jgi:hypothetical protein
LSFAGAVGVGLIIPIGMMLWEGWVFPSFGKKAIGSSPAAATAQSKMVLDYVPSQRSGTTNDPRTSGGADWNFKCLVPPRHVAHVLFVRWTNGVSIVEQGFSAYIKTGNAPAGIDFSISCVPHQVDPSSSPNQLLWNVNLGLGYTSAMLLPVHPGFRTRDTEARLTVLTGHQRVVPLVTSTPSSGKPRADQDGFELRLLLEPLSSPAMRIVPSEKEVGNCIVGAGLDKPLEDVLNLMNRLPKDE